ncbi:MAG: hypothetical protein ACJASX_001005 [Limisphaerales bacterium]|jgi:hypothetical protein
MEEAPAQKSNDEMNHRRLLKQFPSELYLDIRPRLSD